MAYGQMNHIIFKRSYSTPIKFRLRKHGLRGITCVSSITKMTGPPCEIACFNGTFRILMEVRTHDFDKKRAYQRARAPPP